MPIKVGAIKISRVSRILLNNAIYHVMVRDNQKQTTVIEEKDFLKYIDILRQYTKNITLDYMAIV